MTFYLKPPRGTIALRTLRTCVEERLKLFTYLENYGNFNKQQLKVGCVRDGSALDRTSHYMLRLLALASPVLRTFVIKNEKALFLLRLNDCTESHLCHSMKVVQRHAEECLLLLNTSCDDELTTFLHTLTDICKYLSVKQVATHAFHGNHHEECSDLYLKVPFLTCLPFIRRREVELRQGYAFIPCGKWKKLLILLFEKHYLLGMQEMKKREIFMDVMDDPRLNLLVREMESQFSTSDYVQKAAGQREIKAHDVDTESVLFPPCMAHLHRQLRATHRLPHEARRHYTLFLKAVGMPVDEAVSLWSGEYSQPHASCSGCNHSWQKDARKYRYSIRHMYGLEGGRYSYSMPSCSAIQRSVLTSASEEGCPFKHFDDAKLQSCFHEKVKSDASIMNKIIHLKRKNKPMDACAKYLSACLNVFKGNALHEGSDSVTNMYSQKPEDFYIFLKDNILKPNS